MQRLKVVRRTMVQLTLMLPDLNDLMLAEKKAGKPATPGSHQARRHALWDHYLQLRAESEAIRAHLGERRKCSQCCVGMRQRPGCLRLSLLQATAL